VRSESLKATLRAKASLCSRAEILRSLWSLEDDKRGWSNAKGAIRFCLRRRAFEKARPKLLSSLVHHSQLASHFERTCASLGQRKSAPSCDRTLKERFNIYTPKTFFTKVFEGVIGGTFLKKFPLTLSVSPSFHNCCFGVVLTRFFLWQNRRKEKSYQKRKRRSGLLAHTPQTFWKKFEQKLLYVLFLCALRASSASRELGSKSKKRPVARQDAENTGKAYTPQKLFSKVFEGGRTRARPVDDEASVRSDKTRSVGFATLRKCDTTMFWMGKQEKPFSKKVSPIKPNPSQKVPPNSIRASKQ